MVDKSSLSGWNVLVTRPESQAKNICDLITQRGGKVIAFPTIEVVPAQIKDHIVYALTEYDMIIFVSRNAVIHFADKITTAVSALLVSVGDGSAESMRQHGLRVDIQPDLSIGSEGLLEMPQFSDMAGKKVLIVRGNGGRGLLASTLIKRGADVDYLEVYARVLPSPTPRQKEQALTANGIICTSVAGVQNLSLLLEGRLDILLDKPMFVMSERIKDYAISSGFKNVVATNICTDMAVIDQLTKMGIE